MTLVVMSSGTRAVYVQARLDAALAVREVEAGVGVKCDTQHVVSCQLPPEHASGLITIQVQPSAPLPDGATVMSEASASDGQNTAQSNRVSVNVRTMPQVVTSDAAPVSPTTTGVSSPLYYARASADAKAELQDATPTPPATTPTVDPNTPCLKAAMAAATRQGATYSQGGALPEDPINPATGQPYPRTGPNSFDCSGLVWWAYQQAGVSIGTSTYSQVNDGTAIPCKLADLRGAATSCWAPGDLIFLRYGGAEAGPGGGSSQHVAIYVGNGLFMDCYNHAVNCILHDVSRDSFYQRHFWQARRIVSGCEGLTNDPGVPITGPIGEPAPDALCVPDPLVWGDAPGVNYSRSCGPPVLPPSAQRERGTLLRQFTNMVGWLGQTGDMTPRGPAGVHLHLGLDIGTTTDMCRWPLQAQGIAEGEPPPGAYSCVTTWADPLQFLPQANPDTLAMMNGTPAPVVSGPGDPTLSEALVQLPPPGHPATNLLPPNPDKPDGTWWSPGNDDRANKVKGALGGPSILDWLSWLWCLLFGWLPWSGCRA